MGKISFLEKIRIPTYNNPNEIQHGKVEFNYEKCKGCALCAKICPAGSIFMQDKKPQMPELKLNYCIACGCCVAICPDGAVKLKLPYKYTKYYKTIDRGELKLPRL